MRALLDGLVEQAIAYANPYSAVSKALGTRPKGKIVVAGAGKAACKMARAVEAKWEDISGIVVTRHGYDQPLKVLDCLLAAHPVPDQKSHAAAKALLKLVAPLTKDDTLLFLASGGASALVCAPIAGLSFDQKRQLMRHLYLSSAAIGEINTVRMAVSAIKGGGLARAAAPAGIRTLVVSDVAGDDPAKVGSGPTVPGELNLDMIADIFEKYDLSALCDLSLVKAELERRRHLQIPRTADAPEVILTSRDMLNAVSTYCSRNGLFVENLGGAVEGNARDVAAAHFEKAIQIRSQMSAHSRPVVLISGGECTVVKTGNGVGGPNAEYVLALARLMDGEDGLSAVACDTDGVDGIAEVAGARADGQTAAAARAKGLSLDKALDDNDAHSFFAAIGEQIITGPTGTNLNDFRAILITPPSGGGAQ